MAPVEVCVVGPVEPGLAAVEVPIPGGRSEAWELHFLRVEPDCALALAAPRGSRVEVRESPFDA